MQVVSEHELLEFAPPPPPLPEEKDDEKVEEKVEETKYMFGVSRSLVNARFKEAVETRIHRSFSLWDNWTEPEVWQTTDEVPTAASSATQTEKPKKKRRGQPRFRPPPGIRVQLREEREAARSSWPASSSGAGNEGSLCRSSSSWEP